MGAKGAEQASTEVKRLRVQPCPNTLGEGSRWHGKISGINYEEIYG